MILRNKIKIGNENWNKKQSRLARSHCMSERDKGRKTEKERKREKEREREAK